MPSERKPRPEREKIQLKNFLALFFQNGAGSRPACGRAGTPMRSPKRMQPTPSPWLQRAPNSLKISPCGLLHGGFVGIIAMPRWRSFSCQSMRVAGPKLPSAGAHSHEPQRGSDPRRIPRYHLPNERKSNFARGRAPPVVEAGPECEISQADIPPTLRIFAGSDFQIGVLVRYSGSLPPGRNCLRRNIVARAFAPVTQRGDVRVSRIGLSSWRRPASAANSPQYFG